jgi:hypothetical protein
VQVVRPPIQRLHRDPVFIEPEKHVGARVPCTRGLATSAIQQRSSQIEAGEARPGTAARKPSGRNNCKHIALVFYAGRVDVSVVNEPGCRSCLWHCQLPGRKSD